MNRTGPTMKLSFHHLNLATHDVADLHRFYGEVLMQNDMPEIGQLPDIDPDLYTGAMAFRTDGHAQFHVTERDVDVGLKAGKGVNPLDRGHIAFRTDDIEAFKKHLDEKGIPYADYGTTFSPNWWQVYFHDPAGNIIEVHQVIKPVEDGTML